jgi:ubiquinone/menaquinone biosynthesis C-methylase UbiE
LSCPACGGSLDQTVPEGPREIEDGELRCASCKRRWAIRGGIPELTFPDELHGQDVRSRTLWNRIARVYDGINLFTGILRGVSVREERRELIARLGLHPGSAVLEVAAGTGSNLAFLAEDLGEKDVVFGLDLSPRMLDLAKRKVRDLPRPPQLALGNAQSLPFTGGVFDTVLDGAGIKYYSDKGRVLREMLRVVKPGGKVVITELGMPTDKKPTLRQRLLLLWIPGFREGPPLGAVPSDAIDVKLDWDAEETFYTLEFRRAPQHG